MGESKRRKQILGNNYGIPTIQEQVNNAWLNIYKTLAHSKKEKHELIICQCCRDDRGFTIEGIQVMQEQLKTWESPLNVPMLIQMLPQGFKSSETKLFDGFITVWCNYPNHPCWKELFETKVS